MRRRPSAHHRPSTVLELVVVVVVGEWAGSGRGRRWVGGRLMTRKEHETMEGKKRLGTARQNKKNKQEKTREYIRHTRLVITRTRQEKTRQAAKTRQDKTRHDKTRRDKSREVRRKA